MIDQYAAITPCFLLFTCGASMNSLDSPRDNCRRPVRKEKPRLLARVLLVTELASPSNLDRAGRALSATPINKVYQKSRAPTEARRPCAFTATSG
jgi:hypothetical protein